MSEISALETQVRAWLRPQILDAEESRRRWRLLCIQADAELRNLKSQTGTAPLANGFRDEKSETASDSDTTSEAEKTLANVLALERQVEELYSVIANTERELLQVLDSTKVLEERLSDQSACAQRAAANTDAVRNEVKDLAASHIRAREEHKKRCESLVHETETLKVTVRPREVVEADFQSAQVEKTQLHEDVETIAVDIEEVLRHRELLWMYLEEIRTRRDDSIDSRNQSAREVANVRNIARARNVALNRLQGEVLRTKSRCERKRRVLENQLMQCRTELEDSMERSSASAEQLRKMKQQQSKQLGHFRSEIDGLKNEVDEHLLAIRTSESEQEGLLQEEAAIEIDRHRHEVDESVLAQQAVDFRDLAARLEQEVAARESSAQLVRARLVAADEELSEEEQRKETMLSEIKALQACALESEESSNRLRNELEEEQQLCSPQNEEIANLNALLKKIEGLKVTSKEESSELSQMQDSATQMQKSVNKHFGDMSEALRRVSRLKAQHGELVESLPGKSKDALISSIDQTLGKVSRKVEAVISCLDMVGGAPGASVGRTPRGNESFPIADAFYASTSPRSQAALHKRLHSQHERAMEMLFADERKKVLTEQERSLEEARRRTEELRKARQERRQQEEELIRSQQARHWARISHESEIEGLEAQARLVDREASEGAQAVTAEFSDVLQKQALERNKLQDQVDHLRREVEGASAAPPKETIPDREEVHELSRVVSSPTLSHRLTILEEQAVQLQMEEEELQQEYVKLKAAMVASKLQDPCNGKHPKTTDLDL